MDEFNPYAAPLHEQPLSAATPEPGYGVWRDGELLVMCNIAKLPDRCVLCNAPAAGRRMRLELRWFAPFHLLGLSIPLIERRARIEVGICPHHRRKRRNRIIASLLFYFWALGAIAASGRLVGFRGGDWLACVLLGMTGIALISTLVSELFFAAPAVKPHKIEGPYIWLKNVDSGYLDQFPAFSDAAESPPSS